jgi:hypothetical protein
VLIYNCYIKVTIMVIKIFGQIKHNLIKNGGKTKLQQV